MKNFGCIIYQPVILVSLLFAMLTMSGCSSFNPFKSSGISDAEVAQIHRQYTTEDEIISMFGQPYIKTTEGANWQRWTYHISPPSDEAPKAWYKKLFKEDQQSKTLIILFNNGIVRDYRYMKR